MPQFQPRPMVVIRNQLLAFMVLNLLGSCVPIINVEAPKVVTLSSCTNTQPTCKAPTHQIKLITTNTHSC